MLYLLSHRATSSMPVLQPNGNIITGKTLNNQTNIKREQSILYPSWLTLRHPPSYPVQPCQQNKVACMKQAQLRLMGLASPSPAKFVHWPTPFWNSILSMILMFHPCFTKHFCVLLPNNEFSIKKQWQNALCTECSYQSVLSLVLVLCTRLVGAKPTCKFKNCSHLWSSADLTQHHEFHECIDRNARSVSYLVYHCYASAW